MRAVIVGGIRGVECAQQFDVFAVDAARVEHRQFADLLLRHQEGDHLLFDAHRRTPRERLCACRLIIAHTTYRTSSSQPGEMKWSTTICWIWADKSRW